MAARFDGPMAIDERDRFRSLMGTTLAIAPEHMTLFADWVDIDPRTLSLDAAAAWAAVRTRTRASVAQSTFGLSPDLDAITAIAERAGITTCREVVNLTTDPALSDSEGGRVLRLLGQQTDLIA